MSHFYDCTTQPYLTGARTPSQAKKIGAYPSVTTVMGIIKDPFLDLIWSPKKFVELARAEENWDMDEIFRRKFGMRNSPVDGAEVTASEFGTSVHARLETHVNSMIAGEPINMDSEWDSWAEPFIDFLAENEIKPVASELITWDGKIRVAGSVDFIGKTPDGKYFLADYKCRDCKGGGGRFYEKKDCTQLAIESWMLARMWDLSYLPEVTSVCIDIGSKKHFHKNWKPDQIDAGIKRFKLTSDIYWMDFM